MRIIPHLEPYFDEKELSQMTGVVESTYITENKKTEEFLGLIKDMTGAKYALATANGTLALTASLISEGVGPGDEVIIPAFTFIATGNVIKMLGATPVLCDVEMESGCLDVVKCEELITKNTKAIMPVHLYGHAANMAGIMELKQKYNIVIVEDAAESLGVSIGRQHTGAIGDYGVFSFFANKIITCGEGGVILTDSEERYKNLYRIKNHGRDRKGIFVHEKVGYNFCFTDMQAAIGVAQLEKYEDIYRRKKRNHRFYLDNLSFGGNNRRVSCNSLP